MDIDVWMRGYAGARVRGGARVRVASERRKTVTRRRNMRVCLRDSTNKMKKSLQDIDFRATFTFCGSAT